MNKETRYRFKISHPQHGEVEVEAEDRLRAIHAAAQAYGVTRWTTIARELEVVILGKAEEKQPRKRASSRKKGDEQHG